MALNGVNSPAASPRSAFRTTTAWERSRDRVGGSCSFVPILTKHVVVQSVQEVPLSEFVARARSTLEQGSKREVLLFVHGYNVGFEDAVARTAQIAYDLHFEGLATLYSWPSEGSAPKYSIDEANVTWSRPRFAQFLTILRNRLGAETVHILGP